MKMMKSRMFAVFCVLAFCAGVANAMPSEEKMPLDNLPESIVNAVRNRFPRAHFVEAAKEVEHGKVRFEVSLTLGSSVIDVLVSPAGKIDVIERVIAVEDLPKAIAAVVASNFQNGTIRKAEEVIMVSDKGELLEFYEVVVDMVGKRVEVEVLTNGKLKVQGTVEHDEDEKDKDDVEKE